MNSRCKNAADPLDAVGKAVEFKIEDYMDADGYLLLGLKF
jgi:hypothetical protein